MPARTYFTALLRFLLRYFITRERSLSHSLPSPTRMNYSMSPSFMFYDSERRKLKSSTFNSEPASFFFNQFPQNDFELFTVGVYPLKEIRKINFFPP